ncbi:hypothetical protein [Chryseobacterium bernardetii]|uniref:Cell wall anchor protein n=1 Tax=Chryseobacterium bernardetii TaxID=1241978 RepID=A0A3G6T5W1_9FLAO|nr:hypothetical protein [Chryseobacterium bernardetii]AZB24701.1 hypothetical protein EG339_08855 [Chryseobacterium bernardetii]
MRKTLLFSLTLAVTLMFGQTLTEKQMINARAAGYAVIAAKNPGLNFAVMVIPWDGVNSLEYNANTQINPSWQPQAVVKGNYFDQPFDGSDFTTYSSFVTSQAEFDQYKSTGTQWWIICSAMPAFSSRISGNQNNQNVGIGIENPSYNLDVKGTFRVGDVGKFTFNGAADLWFEYPLRGSGGRAMVHDDGNVLALNYNNDFTGGTRLGTSLLVKGDNASLQGKFEAKEIKVTLTPTADFVFDENYNLPKLEVVEKHIKEKKHLPEIASAKEMEREGVNVGEFQIKLLQKIEELTLYTIEQNKQLKKLQESNDKLVKEVTELKSNKN